MLAYIAVRLVGAVLAFWLSITLAFFGLRVAFSRLDPTAFQFAFYGLRQGRQQVYSFEGSPLREYLKFLGAAARWDWGYSPSSSQDVGVVLRDQFPVTLRIGLLAFGLAVAVGVPLGALAATRRGWVDRAITSAATLAYSFPALVLALLLYALSVRTINLFDVSWTQPGWRKYLLPVLVLGLGAGGYLARVTRVAVLAVLGRDYVRTARAKGLRQGLIVRRHIIPNALPTMLAALGPTLGLLLAGSALVEFVLGVPGTGNLLLTAFAGYDYPLILAGVALYTALILGSNLATDVLARSVIARSGRGVSARGAGRGRGDG